MKLLTKKITERMIANYDHADKNLDEQLDLYAEVKLFNPVGIGTWWLSELDPETNVAFGIAEIHEKEYGYVSLDELKNLKLPLCKMISMKICFRWVDWTLALHLVRRFWQRMALS
mgnify:CR=1 FL=1